MSMQQNSIDLRTLQEVQRLLQSTDFASIDDLARRSGGATQLSEALAMTRVPERPAPAARAESSAMAPLPRRR